MHAFDRGVGDEDVCLYQNFHIFFVFNPLTISYIVIITSSNDLHNTPVKQKACLLPTAASTATFSELRPRMFVYTAAAVHLFFLIAV